MYYLSGQIEVPRNVKLERWSIPCETPTWHHRPILQLLAPIEKEEQQIGTLSDGTSVGQIEYLGGLYQGSMDEKGNPHGFGVYERFGDSYRGNFKNGLFHGYGEMRYRHGASYIGQWVDGVAEGNGHYLDTDSLTLYEGNFSRGLPADYHLSNTASVLRAEIKFKNILTRRRTSQI